MATVPAPTFLTGDAVPDYLKGVEIVTAGMNWPASTGDVTITMEHIADAVRAANDDPHIQVPRLKLGHTSSLNGDHENHNPFAALGDAEPSFGRFVNLRTTNDGAVLVGDVEDVPAWLAECAPSMFPNRSMENAWNVTTEGGKRYSMVITAVSFLGAYLPACKDLEDLVRMAAEGPAALTTKEATVPALSVSTDTIRQRFNFDWATGENGVEADTYWWWARDIRVDPSEVIADDDEGNLWSVPFTSDGEDVVTFGEPARVRQTYVPAAAAAAFTRPAKTPRPNAASGRNNNERTTMDESVRDFLVGRGINPDEATEDQINAASVLAAAAVLPGTEGEPPEVVPEAVPDAGREPVAAGIATERGIVVDKDALAQLQADAAAGREARTAQLAEKREADLSAWIHAGKFPPSARQAYADQLAKGGDVEASTREFIEALPDHTVPLAARGEVPVAAGLDDQAGFSLLPAGLRARTTKEG